MTVALAIAALYGSILAMFVAGMVSIWRKTERRRQWCRDYNAETERLRKEMIANGERDPRKWARPHMVMSDELGW